MIERIVSHTADPTPAATPPGVGRALEAVVPPARAAAHEYSMGAADSATADRQRWLALAPLHRGSWWPAWHDSLLRRSGVLGPVPPPGSPATGYAPLCDAPGTYVRAR